MVFLGRGSGHFPNLRIGRFDYQKDQLQKSLEWSSITLHGFSAQSQGHRAMFAPLQPTVCPDPGLILWFEQYVFFQRPLPKSGWTIPLIGTGTTRSKTPKIYK